MQTIVEKWGKSLGVRLPALYAKTMLLTDGSTVELDETPNGVFLKPVKKEPLRTLLAKITSRNVHTEIDAGPAAGNELW